MNSKNLNDMNNDLNYALGMHAEKIQSLELRIEVLNTICNEINPYVEMTEEMKTKLQNFGIFDFSNPFHVTNALVTLLEDSINELHQFKPFEEHEL